MEGLGNLADFILTRGNVNDCTQAIGLLDQVVDAAGRGIGVVAADKGYDASHIVDHIVAIGATAVIPQLFTRKKTREVDWAHYKNRNLVERFFCRIKHFRRIATRFEKLAARFISFIHLAAAYVWLA